MSDCLSAFLSVCTDISVNLLLSVLLVSIYIIPFCLSEGLESLQRESMSVGETSFSSMTPMARFSEEEKKVSIIKAPHYEGIGPVDESGLPLAIRTVSYVELEWAQGWESGGAPRPLGWAQRVGIEVVIIVGLNIDVLEM